MRVYDINEEIMNSLISQSMTSDQNSATLKNPIACEGLMNRADFVRECNNACGLEIELAHREIIQKFNAREDVRDIHRREAKITAEYERMQREIRMLHDQLIAEANESDRAIREKYAKMIHEFDKECER